MAQKKAPIERRKRNAKKIRVGRNGGVPAEASSAQLRVPFPVVAIGASAGGLAAYKSLLEALPAKSGMAFVLIQHLEPKHESALTALLSKATSMPVIEVADGTAVEPDHVYVIPPNKNLTIREGILRLAPRSDIRGLQRPIDEFLVALAEEQGNAAVGVVLSGTGSDGTYGLKAVKAGGGMTFAQEPKTAQWPGMPSSAISAGSVDFILSPKLIASELARIGRHPYLAEARDVPEGGDLDKVCLILRSSTGIDFRLYKQATARRRIARRMALQKIATLGKYAQILKQNSQEAQALADDIFIHVTSFFRDPESFEALRKQVLTKFRTRRPEGDPLRIWIAGCSTGEEVYSIAMLLSEELGERASRMKIQIFGTDIQERAVEHARSGVYTAAAVAGVSQARLKRFFVEADHGHQIQKFVRDLCVFARHDLAKDPPFSKLDLVSCRNVLIYMGSALQKRLLSVFQYALKPGGFLFLGNSESAGEYSDAFSVDDRKHRIYLRKPSVTVAHRFNALENFLQSPVEPPRGSQPGAAVDFSREAERVLLEHYTPAALIVDSDLHIVHFQGDTSPYLAPATGQPSFHLLKMVRPELIVDLRAAIHKAKREHVAVQRDGVTFEHEGKPAAVRLEVRLLKAPNGKKADLLVVFQKTEVLRSDALSQESGSAGLKKPAADRAGWLERELENAREHLRTLISDHETAQEEMKAANEEILSSNEELQSTNEELETAKEELQSSNEELTTLNDELQHRNQELNILMDDLNNLLVGVDIPVLVLDGELRVRRFTPVAGALLNLIPGDVGRHFADIASALAVVDWQGLFSEVRRNGRLIEREAADKNGHRYSLRIRPYTTRGNNIDGFLVVLFDIDASKRALEQAQESRDLALKAEELNDSILNSLTANVAVLTLDGTIAATNDAWKRFARENGNPPMTTVGSSLTYLEICRRAASAGDGDAQVALQGIQEVLEGRRASFHFEYPCHSEREQRWFLMNVATLKSTNGGAVITQTNITDRKLAEIAANTSESMMRALLASAPQSVMAVGEDQKIAFVNGNVDTMFGYTRDELLGQPLELLIPESARRRHSENQKGYFANMQNRPMGVGLNLEARRKNGKHFPVEVGLGAVKTATSKLAVAFVTDITERRRMEQAAETHATEIHSLAASLLTAQEEERRRVSRELHDQICQQLASLAIDIGSLAADLPLSENGQDRLKALQSRVVKASEETRHIAYALHSSVLDDLGLVASLQDLGKDFSKQTKIGVKFTHDVLPASVPREIASCLYRVAQESLQNIIKHANAKHVTVTLALRKGSVVLRISDDGAGFDPQSVKGRGGLGLIGMEERARLVSGKLSIATQPRNGTRVALEIPLPVSNV
jgi:PAS domain S-box-containing protein